MAKNETPRAWQRMLSGRRLDLLNPSPLDIELADIAHGLARVARWNGQTSGPHAFSVAQHCLVVEELLAQIEPKITAQERLYALLHDAPEYVIGDMISPFKSVIGSGYRDVEKRLQEAVHLRFSLPAEIPAALAKVIKHADRISAYMEAVQLAGFAKAEARKLFEEPPTGSAHIELMPLPVEDAQRAFADRVSALDVA
jgi:5'-deoxynucleotidase YfbR-like HD superfamily hydrolase